MVYLYYIYYLYHFYIPSYPLGLDPVFFMERARSSWGRENKLGKLRIRQDPPNYRRKMLTSMGHPGVYGNQEMDDLL